MLLPWIQISGEPGADQKLSTMLGGVLAGLAAALVIDPIGCTNGDDSDGTPGVNTDVVSKWNGLLKNRPQNFYKERGPLLLRTHSIHLQAPELAADNDLTVEEMVAAAGRALQKSHREVQRATMSPSHMSHVVLFESILVQTFKSKAQKNK